MIVHVHVCVCPFIHDFKEVTYVATIQYLVTSLNFKQWLQYKLPGFDK